jgi:hypothetical protein
MGAPVPLIVAAPASSFPDPQETRPSLSDQKLDPTLSNLR